VIVEFGDWRLVPVDARNWELCHRHVTSKGKDEGVAKWHRLGRYYSHNTLHEALRYAVSRELMLHREDEAMVIWDALKEYERITRQLVNAAQELPATYRDALGHDPD